MTNYTDSEVRINDAYCKAYSGRMLRHNAVLKPHFAICLAVGIAYSHLTICVICHIFWYCRRSGVICTDYCAHMQSNFYQCFWISSTLDIYRDGHTLCFSWGMLCLATCGQHMWLIPLFSCSRQTLCAYSCRWVLVAWQCHIPFLAWDVLVYSLHNN